MNTETKLFAFRLADKMARKTDQNTKWKARDGVAIAGCCQSSTGLPHLQSTVGDTVLCV